MDGSRRSALTRLDDPHAQQIRRGAASLAAPHRPGAIATSHSVDTDPFAPENTLTPPRDRFEGCCAMCGCFSSGATIRVGQLFNLPNWPETPPRYNIAPSQALPP